MTGLMLCRRASLAFFWVGEAFLLGAEQEGEWKRNADLFVR